MRRGLLGMGLDVAGTWSDRGACVPATAMRALFAKVGVSLTLAQARQGMGLRKDDHIRSILRGRGLETRFIVSELMTRLRPIMLRELSLNSVVIHGSQATVRRLFNRYGLRWGAMTGYTREMLDVILGLSRQQGMLPHASVASDEVSHGRPFPFMIYRVMEQLGISNPSAMLIVDDTNPGIQAGHNARCWTVGVYQTSSYAHERPNPPSMEHAYQHARAKLNQAAPHYTIPDINHLPDVVADINRKLSRSIHP